jgi:hypothetical protein
MTLPSSSDSDGNGEPHRPSTRLPELRELVREFGYLILAIAAVIVAITGLIMACHG